MISLLLVLVLLLLICIGALVSLNEISFFSLPHSKVKAFRSSLDPKKRAIFKLLQKPKDLLVSIFFINTFANILMQNISSDFINSISTSWWLKVGLPFAVILIFGELVPKYIGLLYNEPIAIACAPYYEWFQRVTQGVREKLTHFINMISRISFFFLKVDVPLDEDEFEHILKTSEKAGLLHKEERELIDQWMSMKDKQVKEIMSVRSQLEYYDIEEPLSNLSLLFSEKGLSEVPVCRKSPDNLLGMCSALDYFLFQTEIDEPQKLTKILYKPYFIPEITLVSSLLRQFEKREEKTALVVDEHGAIVGMITKEDILKNLVSPLTLFREEKEEYIRISKGAVIANGTCPLEKINELFDADLQTSYDSVTIGGYLIEKIGSIPQSDETYQEDDLFFRILSVDPTRIKKIYIQNLDSKKEIPFHDN